MSALLPFALVAGAKALVTSYFWQRRFRAYDPGWLVDLARRQHPTARWLGDALEECTRARVEDRYYLRFKGAPAVLTEGATVRGNMLLRDPVEGLLVVDVHPDGRIAGLEFRSRREREAE